MSFDYITIKGLGVRFGQPVSASVSGFISNPNNTYVNVITNFNPIEHLAFINEVAKQFTITNVAAYSPELGGFSLMLTKSEDYEDLKKYIKYCLEKENYR